MPRLEAAPRPNQWSTDVLRDIEWKRFEDLCLAFYRAKGIRAESTPLGPDGGVDVRLYQDGAAPDRCTAIVQCKAWGDRQVGVKPVRELRGVMAHEQLKKAFFMAPGGYTDEAKAFARENRITLLDGTLFLAMLKRLPNDENLRLLAFATEGEMDDPDLPALRQEDARVRERKRPVLGLSGIPEVQTDDGDEGKRVTTQPRIINE